MAVQSHLAVAATKGMKAGFTAYREQIERSGLETVRATREQLDSMGKRAAFAWYCAKHGPDVTAFQEFMLTKPKSAKPNGLTSEIEAARKRLAELEAQAKSEKPAKRTRSSKPASEVKENLWREWAVRKNNIPTTVGATFTYKGKRRTSTFKVTRVTSEGVYSVRVA